LKIGSREIRTPGIFRGYWGEKMQTQLNYLVQLQQIDRAIENVLVDTRENPNKLARIDQETRAVEDSFRAFLEEKEGLKKGRRDLEREVEELDQRIKKSQVKLMEVKTNKEYRAMLTEIDDLKKAKNEKEDFLLELMEKWDESLQREKSLKQTVEVQTTAGSLKKTQLEAEGKKNEGELSLLSRQRQDLIRQVDPALLKQYEFLRERLKGVAVAEAREAICLSCHMQIPPQLYNELFRQDKMITCPSCLRFLYLSDAKENHPEQP
jgi:uncharacterized protein